MQSKKDQKGVVLLMVMGLSLVLFVGITGLLFVLKANIRSREAFKERIEAYYLCETGAAVAILDIRAGHIGRGRGQWTQRTFDYGVDNITYRIHYEISKTHAGFWQIVSSVGPSSGFYRTYKLKVVGQRSVPIFIWGFPAK